MSHHLHNSLDKLVVVSKLSGNTKLQKQLLKEFCNDPSFLFAIVEIAINTVRKRVPLTQDQLNKLRPHIKLIRKIALESEHTFKKRSTREKIVQQSGGFLPILIPTIASILTEVALHQFTRSRESKETK